MIINEGTLKLKVGKASGSVEIADLIIKWLSTPMPALTSLPSLPSHLIADQLFEDGF